MTRKRGRPAFSPTKAQRHQVSVAAGAGMAHEEIALALGISRVTLNKHFGHELSVGAYQRRLEVLSAIHRQAKKGNVAAARAYSQLTPRIAAPPADVDADRPARQLGKKEQANLDAATAQEGTEWESLLTPPSSVQ